MGHDFAFFLLLAVSIGLAAPFFPFASRLARRCIQSWKAVVLVAALMLAIGYVTFPVASVVGAGLSFLLFHIISPLLRWSDIGQGAIAFLFTWVGVWAV